MTNSLQVHPLIAQRWSPFLFDPRPVEEEKVRLLVEAASRAPSSRNEQPWHFVFSERGSPGFANLFDTLVEFNQQWAHQPPLLGLAIAKLDKASGEPNRFAFHDVGLATGNLLIQASHMGLVVRCMGGFDNEKARLSLAIPEGYSPTTALAIGYLGAEPLPSPHIMKRHTERRPRKDPVDFFFRDRWGKPWQ